MNESEMEPYQRRNFDKLMQAYGNPDLTDAQRKTFRYLAKDEDSVIDSLCETARLIRGIR